MIIPAAWLIFVGLALPIRFTDHYLDFVTPGVLAMTTLNASLGGGSLIILDRTLGFFNKFLALPTPRESILFGKVLVIMIRGFIQTTLILIMAFGLGAQVYNLSQLAETYFILILFGTLCSVFATTLALYVDDHDSYAALYAMISMPVFFTSTAMMPYSAMPSWMLVPAAINPLSFAIDGIRIIQTGGIPFFQTFILSLLALLIGAVSVRVFRNVEV
jgi:ABC-2 type transport system permease protein